MWVTLWWMSATDLSDQEEVVDEAFFSQLEESCLQALVLMRESSHSDICWKDNTARQKQSRIFLECIDNSFLKQATEEQTKRGTLLDLSLIPNQFFLVFMKVRATMAAVTMRCWTS